MKQTSLSLELPEERTPIPAETMVVMTSTCSPVRWEIRQEEKQTREAKLVRVPEHSKSFRAPRAESWFPGQLEESLRPALAVLSFPVPLPCPQLQEHAFASHSR